MEFEAILESDRIRIEHANNRCERRIRVSRDKEDKLIDWIMYIEINYFILFLQCCMLLYCVTILACTTYGLQFCVCLKACVTLCPREPYLILVMVLAARPETRELWS